MAPEDAAKPTKKGPSSKSGKKNAARKAKREADQAADGGGIQLAQEMAKTKIAEIVGTPSADDPAKKIKKLKKLLKQIDELQVIHHAELNHPSPPF
jgi:hypothetical protein